MSVFSFATMGTKALCNIDTYVFSSMQGTIESASTVLLAGRINDAYALLRKYYDSAIINVYSNLYINKNFSTESLIVAKISDWIQGKDKLPKFGEMCRYIKDSGEMESMNDLFYIDQRYKLLRERCNDHTHYNFFRYAVLNDSKVYEKDRGALLDQFSEDALDLFVLHLGYIFFLNSHYMTSGDYMDALECGMQPQEDSQYWVAPFIQDVFNKVLTPRRPDVTALIKASSPMQLL